MGKYIYGIVKKGKQKGEFGPIGIGGSVVYTVGVADIACIVSDSPFFDYKNKTKEVIAFHLSVYQKVIEQAMKDCTVLPVKFGTIVNQNEVRDILLKGYQEIIEALDKMDNKIELDVVALWVNFNRVLKEIGEYEEIRSVKVELNANPTKITVNDKIKLGKLIKTELDKRREETAYLIKDILNKVVDDTYEHECLSDKMIMNAAFLIEREKEKKFDNLMSEIDKKMSGNVNFRCVGPLPPYSFSCVEVKRIKDYDVDEGKVILGLERESTPSAVKIKDAYRIMARKYHPDMFTTTPGLKENEHFNKLTQAYELLLDYSQPVGKGNPANHGTIIIKL